MDASTILKAFEKYGSDKANHGYAEFYAEHMPENPKKILEIGVKNGASLRAWRELYPNALIYGFDLFEEFHPKAESIGKNVFLFKLDQSDTKALSSFRNIDFDVIIDDGSHNARDQMISFITLAKQGTHYFIEDLHCNDEDFYSQGLPMFLRAKYILDTAFDAIGADGKILYVKC